MSDPDRLESELDAAGRAQLQSWREELDQRNRALVDGLQARARLVLEVARFKRAHGLPLFDDQREREMLRQLLADPGAGLAAEELAPILRLAMRGYRRAIQRASAAADGSAPPIPPERRPDSGKPN